MKTICKSFSLQTFTPPAIHNKVIAKAFSLQTFTPPQVPNKAISRSFSIAKGGYAFGNSVLKTELEGAKIRRK